MSRSGYTDDYGDDDPLALGRYRQAVKRAIEGKRGQAFLRELAAAMDAMPVKELIAHELVDADGACCTIGVVCKARGIVLTDGYVRTIDEDCPDEVGALVGIAASMAAEIEFVNDECGPMWNGERGVGEAPAERWQRMRRWVAGKVSR